VECSLLGSAFAMALLLLVYAANALGAWLGGLVIAAGWGHRAPGLVGAGLPVAGLAILLASAHTARRGAAAAVRGG
jgi:MFS transporter, DHA1 family, inner membrane transport protein